MHQNRCCLMTALRMVTDRTASINHNDLWINSSTLAWAGLEHSHFSIVIVVCETLALDTGLSRCLLFDKVAFRFSLTRGQYFH